MSDYKWLTVPGETRTMPWVVWDQEQQLPLDVYLVEYLVSRYRLKLRDHYPDLSKEQIRVMLLAFRTKLGN
jgi:hypothetical protein